MIVRLCKLMSDLACSNLSVTWPPDLGLMPQIYYLMRVGNDNICIWVQALRERAHGRPGARHPSLTARRSGVPASAPPEIMTDAALACASLPVSLT